MTRLCPEARVSLGVSPPMRGRSGDTSTNQRPRLTPGIGCHRVSVPVSRAPEIHREHWSVARNTPIRKHRHDTTENSFILILDTVINIIGSLVNRNVCLNQVVVVIRFKVVATHKVNRLLGTVWEKLKEETFSELRVEENVHKKIARRTRKESFPSVTSTSEHNLHVPCEPSIKTVSGDQLHWASWPLFFTASSSSSVLVSGPSWPLLRHRGLPDRVRPQAGGGGGAGRDDRQEDERVKAFDS